MSRKETASHTGRPMGTPQKLTRALQEGICAELRRSVPQQYAAEIVGIAARTFYSWLEKGAQGIPPYAAFSRAVRRAIAEAVCSLTARALARGPGAPQALGILERRFSREYGRRPISKTREEARLETERRDVETIHWKPEALRKFNEAIALATATLNEKAKSMNADPKLSAPITKSVAGRRGRPARSGRKPTPATQEGILAALRIAVPPKYAAEREGIEESTFDDWLAKGELGYSPTPILRAQCTPRPPKPFAT